MNMPSKVPYLDLSLLPPKFNVLMLFLIVLIILHHSFLLIKLVAIIQDCLDDGKPFSIAN